MTLPLTDQARRRIGLGFGLVSVVLTAVAVGSLAIRGQMDFLVAINGLTFGVDGLGFGVLTLVMIRSQPRNGAVWAIAWAGLFSAMYAGAVAGAAHLAPGGIDDLTYEAFRELSPSELPLGAAIALSPRFWAVYPAIWLPLTLGLLLFPDGHPPSPRWRWVGWWSVLAIATGAVAAAVSGAPWSETPISVAEGTVPGPLGALMTAGFLLASVSSVVSIASLIPRYRRSFGETRSQIRWIAFGAALVVAFIFSIGSISTEGGSNLPYEILGVAALGALMACYGIAIMRYRLYDIDVVISKTVTYGALAAFITGVYAFVVVGVGTLIGGGEEPSLALSIVAVAIVAVAFEPVRRRVQHWANVVVYGKRATPYEVLAAATAGLADTRDPHDALRQVTALVADGTGASEVVLWLSVGGVMHPRASSPAQAVESLVPVSESMEGPGPTLDDVPGDRVVAIRHRGEVLGALSVTKDRGDPVTGADEKLLADVSAGAGVLVRNLGLNAELEERAEELRLSRRRLVAAHDTERHRLERDLHDGAQQQVVALKVKLGIARTLAEREGADTVADLVASLSDTTQEAVDGMRAVAHGIYPPLLESDGLVAALGGAKRALPIPVEIVAEGIGRYDRSIEESIYFALSGILSAAVDAGASRAVIALTGTDGTFGFSIDVDATPRNMVAVADRMAALDGTFTTGARGRTSVAISGTIPVPSGGPDARTSGPEMVGTGPHGAGE